MSSLPIQVGSMSSVSIWRHLAPYDTPKSWQSRAMVGKIGFKMGGSLWCQPLSDVHGIRSLIVNYLCVGFVTCVQNRARLP